MNARVSLRSFNLNTLPILREILIHGSVGKAAIALNVSQPALSGALKQLRAQFGDELIVRSGGSMKLTPRAEALLAPLEQALSAVQKLLVPSAQDFADLQVVFRIATTDHVMNVLGAALVRLLLRENLNIQPHFLNAGGHSAEQLLKGEIDFIIMPKLTLVGSHVYSREQHSLNSEFLFAEALIGIARSDDKDLARGLSAEEYLARPHVSLNLDPQRNISVEQAFLAGNSLRQNDVAQFSNYISLLGVVASTSCIALVPERLATRVKDTFDLQTFAPPLAFPPLEWTMIWHRRNDDDQTFARCRTILKSCAGATSNSMKQDELSVY